LEGDLTPDKLCVVERRRISHRRRQGIRERYGSRRDEEQQEKGTRSRRRK